MDMHQIRLDNLIKLEAGFRLKKDFANAVDVTPSYIRQFKTRDRVINEKTARKIEAHLNLKIGHMDMLHGSHSSVSVINEDLDVLIGLVSNNNHKTNLGTLTAMDGEYVKQSWLDQHKYEVSDLITIINTQPNMSPEYEVKDRLVVYKASENHTPIYTNNVNYVFKDGLGGHIVHKVHTRMNGDLLLTSRDSENRPDDLIPADQVPSLKCLGVIVKMVRYF